MLHLMTVTSYSPVLLKWSQHRLLIKTSPWFASGITFTRTLPRCKRSFYVRPSSHLYQKSDRQSAHERIQAIGGVNADGTRWSLPQADAIAGIEAGTWRFWVTAKGHSVWVIVSTSAAGNKYLKTQNDGEHPNNLLSLPECPWRYTNAKIDAGF